MLTKAEFFVIVVMIGILIFIVHELGQELSWTF